MYAYLTKVIVIAGFYSGCNGVVMGHRESVAYYVHLTCKNGDVTVETSDWVAKKLLQKVVTK